MRWSIPDGEQRLMAQAQEMDALRRMRGYLRDAVPVGRGESLGSG